ncbi:MAG: Stk1 family PASTA domain-containing Ser/Thr kinase [Oscillospiraceae bacterium]|nr:Stk1 family PASTA domain-containing Ser/Thr kinase [Oscillospiraceae bacterium]
MDRYIGQLLDNRYEILEIIGAGGMAVVYKARCHRLNRLVAIKILKDENMEDEDFRRHFHDESRAVAMLSHPNIVSVYDVSSNEEKDYIVMELIDGITLKQYLEQKGRLNWKQTLHFAMNIAKALEHAHSRGLVHRDIKPHNVMVLKNGAVKVADFGIARLMESDNTMTKEAIGSVHYISPEQAKGSRVDNRSDLYSLGVVMFDMITGRTPFDGESPVAVAIQHINGGAPLPSTIAPSVPKGLEQIIMKAMAHDLPDRYINATAMLQDLEEFRNNPNVTFMTMPQSPQMERRSELYLRPALQNNDAKEDALEEPSLPARKEVRWHTPPKKEPVDDNDYDEDNSVRGRMTTIAVVICSLVAILAIIIFMILLTENDAAVASTPERGEQVMQQQMPTQLPQPTQNRQEILATTLGADTCPATAYQGGQTTSSTQSVVLVEMKNLVNMTRQEAEAVLSLQGFTDVQWVEQESWLPSGTVIGQSVAPQTQVDVNMPLTLVCAAGTVSMNCTFDMPFFTESYYLTIMLDGRPVVTEQRMEPYRATASFTLTGNGKQTCQIYINGELYYSVMVDFDAYAAK